MTLVQVFGKEEEEKEHALRKRLFAANQLVARLEKKLTAARYARLSLQCELDALGTPILPGVEG
jgi:hypothetical protein